MQAKSDPSLIVRRQHSEGKRLVTFYDTLIFPIAIASVGRETSDHLYGYLCRSQESFISGGSRASLDSYHSLRGLNWCRVCPQSSSITLKDSEHLRNTEEDFRRNNLKIHQITCHHLN